MSPTVVSIASRSRFLQSKYRLIEEMGGEFVVNRLRALRTLRVTVGFAVRRKPSSAEPVERIAARDVPPGRFPRVTLRRL